jgi:hypothetical protein
MDQDNEFVPILGGDASYKERNKVFTDRGLLQDYNNNNNNKRNIYRPIIDHKAGVLYSPAKVYLNFLAMCISFSLNHSCVVWIIDITIKSHLNFTMKKVSCIAYASSELGDKLSSYFGGIFFVCFALTTFLAASPMVIAMGWKKSLVIGSTGFCVYVSGFLLSIAFLAIMPTFAWAISCIAAAIGGSAGGLLWTAQAPNLFINFFGID